MAAAKPKKPATPKAPTDTSGVVEPSVRIFTQWTPALIRSAVLMADGGSLYQLANLCEWVLADDRVKSTLGTRINALLGLEPTFAANGDKRRSNRAVKALDAGEDWWTAYPESEVGQLLRWGLVLGVAPARHNWTKADDHQGRDLPMPEFWHPQHLRFDWPSRQWFTRVAQIGTASGFTEVVLEPGDGEWILHTPFGKNRPWSLGLVLALAPLVLLKHYALQDWAQISERGIMLVLTCLDTKAAGELQGYTKEARKQLAESIYARGKQGVAALPPGIDLKAVQAALKADDIQGALIDLCNESIAILIRGGDLGTKAGGGASNAAVESQERTGDGANLRFDAQSWTSTAHDQSLIWWAQYNYGDPKLAPWPEYPVNPKTDVGVKAKATHEALEDLDMAEKLGLEVDRNAFLDEYEIDWAKAGKRPPAAVPPPVVEATPTVPGLGDGTDPVQPGTGPAPGAPAPAKGAPAAPVKKSADWMFLASGASSKENRGFIEGQLYTDALVERSTEHGAEAIQVDVKTLLGVIAEATDYDDLRTRLNAAFKSMDPEQLSSLVERSMVLAELAGRAAVIQDVVNG